MAARFRLFPIGASPPLTVAKLIEMFIHILLVTIEAIIFAFTFIIVIDLLAVCHTMLLR